MCCHRIVEELPPAVTQDDQAIQELEANGRHDEQARSGNAIRMVSQEGRPTLARLFGALDYVLGDGRFGDLDAELEQPAVNSRRTPQPVGPAHSRINSRIFLGIAGRPPLDWDFQRQKALNPRRCQRISVSSLMIATVSTTAGQRR